MKKILVLLIVLVSVPTFSQNFNKAKIDSLFQVLETKDKYMGSVVVSENGKIIYTNAIGKEDIESNKKATVSTKYRIGSISKMFTSTLVFKAIEEKKLSLNQTIESYFPTIENASKITISNLLNHRSGIYNFTSADEYASYSAVPKTSKEMVAIIAKGKSVFEPNSKGEYSNSNYVLLSYILEEVYKQSYAALVQTKIAKPLGLKNTYFGGKISTANNESYSYSYTDKWNKETETDTSIPMGAGGMVSTPTDLTHFIEALFAGKLIAAASLEQMKTMQDKYGMGIFQVPFYDKIGYGHTGGIDGFRSALSYFPESKLSVAITSNGMNYGNNDIVIAILSSYYNRKFEIPTFTTLDLKTEDLDAYLGVYASDTFPLAITVTKDNTKLMAQATGQGAFPLEATKKDSFEFRAAGITLEFNPIANQMTIFQGGTKNVLTKK
ncbi:CubicO group peptidase, beta-lactamase class C family [Flavobacterium gillisiae]|uniref:CubicO group peptidase, beta-lactamase class C family n=1 Tax=Flavobacterium gillisiae TaxID=150146 RepID=A0A1H4C3C0_9FLAO|nr:serine hydrolase domain-containing protein [Flavobacterium gillisiae]SEA54844.1 CubicO group peptidase, beta-lactamase class C family [Flavobacterium gillisiae]